MMRYSLFFLLYIIGFHTCAQQDVRPYPMEEKSLLWQIEGKDINTPSYLFGTIHFIDSSKYFFPEKLNEIIVSSDLIIMEIDESISNPLGYMNLLMLDSGSVLDFVSPEQADSLLHWFDEHMGISKDMFDMSLSKMKPFVIYSMMLLEGETLDLTSGNESPMQSYDLNIQAIAIDSSVDIIGLETVPDQIGFFDSLDSLVQGELIMSGIRKKPDVEVSDFNAMEEIYLNQDIDSMYSFSSSSMGEMNSMESILLTTRNKNWIPKISAMIENNACFIAVGAGHLGGPEGLIRLLEAEGYTLTPIKL